MAAIAVFSACQTIEKSQILPSEFEKVLVSATLGADTKTYLEYDQEANVFKNLWSSDDGIAIIGYDSTGAVTGRRFSYLTEGAGTNKATFAIEPLEAETYMAYYGYGYYKDNYEIAPELNQYQGFIRMESFYDNYYPMVAVSDSLGFSFKNLCSVLRIGITGNSYLDNIVITANDPEIKLAGVGEIVWNDENPVMVMNQDSTAFDSITYYFRNALETTPTNCYVVIPSQTYPGGITLTLNNNFGSQSYSFTQDLTFERSQIRTIPTLEFNVDVPNSWSIISSASGWAEDIMLEELESGIYVYSGLEISVEDEMKFRANGSWDINLGASGDIAESGVAISLLNDGSNIRVAEDGVYDIVLDINNMQATFYKMPDVVDCANYDEVAEVADGTQVRVQGYVFATYGRGFVLNIGDRYNNCILVYQGLNQSAYQPVLGNCVEIIAEKTTYRNLPELKNISSVSILKDVEYDYGYARYYNLINPEYFANIYIDRYDYVKMAGTLDNTNGYWNLLVDGVDTRIGSIEYPIQDLTEFVGKKVVAEGWFIGFSGTNNKYLNIVLKKIYEPSGDGSTEDVTPGDDIVTLPEIPTK